MTRREAGYLLPICALLAYWQFRYYGYVKDDTFISLRYAYNVANGHGMVFNFGQTLEGYTNFLWIMLAVPAYWLGIDPLHWIKFFGILSGQAGIFLVYALVRFFNRDRPTAFGWLLAAIWGTAPTVVLWSTSGMEGVGAAVLCSGGVFFAMRVFYRDADDKTANRHAAIAAGLMVLGAMTRPEGNAVIAMVGLFAGLDGVRRKNIGKPWWIALAVILGVLVPYHAWRIIYFGDMYPNTYYAKASMGAEGYSAGFQYITELVSFIGNAGLFPLALFGLVVAGERRWARWLAGALALFFIGYLIKIGSDEMKWFRLYLPVLPLVYALAATGLQQITEWAIDGADKVLDRNLADPLLPAVGTMTAAALVAGGITAACMAGNMEFIGRKADWHDTYLTQSRDSFMDMGRYVRERSQAGDVISFQDLGAAPYAAPDLRWVDMIGILDKNVAMALRKYSVNPFLRGIKNRTLEGRQDLKDFDRTVRDYVFEQDPDWLAFIAYVGSSDLKRLEQEVDLAGGYKDSLDRAFRKRIRNTSHAHRIPDDNRFIEDYQFEKYWKRNKGYWLVLYRAKDHQPQ